MSQNIAQRFAKIFAGNKHKHGRYHLADATRSEKNKLEGRGETLHEPVTGELFEQHLAGEYSLGILPLYQFGDMSGAHFAVIDADYYSEPFELLLARYLPKIKRLWEDGFPVIPAESKSGGLHLYVFGFHGDLHTMQAANVLKITAALVEYLGLPADTEVFPKGHDATKGNCPGGWINLPYFGVERPAYHPATGERLTVEQFVELVDPDRWAGAWAQFDRKAEPQQVAPRRDQIPVVNVTDEGEWADAPPCVQYAVESQPAGDGERNDWLAKAAGVFARLVDQNPDDERHGEAVLFKLAAAGCDPAVEDDEARTVWESAERGDYVYGCRSAPLKTRCNRALCMRRKYGVNVAHGVAPIGQTELETLLADGDLKPKTTDVRVAETVVHWLGGNLKYVAERDEWLTLHPGAGWLGSYGNHTLHLMLTAVGKLFDELHDEIKAAGQGHPLDHLEGVVKAVASKLLNKPGRANIVACMAQLAEFRTSVRDWNCDPYAIGAPDGNWDVRTGKRLPDETLISKRIAVPFADVESAPEPAAFLNTLDIGLKGDAESVAYVQTVLGAGLLGVLTREFCVLWGRDGFNGKSFVSKCVAYVLGDYCVTLPRETILKTGQRQSQKDRARADLALLEGARLYLVSELEPGDKIDEALIKMLTGSDSITFRLQYEKDYQTFTPTGKLVLVTNYMPSLETYDKPIVRRTRIVPYLGQIPADMDRGPAFIDVTKVQEAPGVLAWLVEGARRFLAEGLTAPDVVGRTVEQFVNENDPVRDFARGCDHFEQKEEHPYCHMSKGIKRAGVWLAFRKWAALQGLKPKIGSREFYRQFEDAVGVDAIKSTWQGSRGVWLYPGLWLTEDAWRQMGLSADGDGDADPRTMNGGLDS